VDPGPFFYIYITFYFKHHSLSASIIYLLTANKYLLPHDTFNPLFSANQWDWQPHCKLGQSILVVLCAGSTLLLAPSTSFLALLPKSASNNLRKCFLSPTGRLNFGFITEGKLTTVLITPYSWWRGSTPAMPMLEGFLIMERMWDPANSTVIRRHRETQVLPRFGPLVG
jgi:hypothetical protein